jgi:hypothetical protein
MSSEADDSLDLLIRLKSDTEGAGPAKAELGELAGAQGKATAATEEGTKATGKHTVGLHAMYRMFHALNEVVPGLGVVMQAVFSPVGAAISLAVMALQLFREHMKKVNEEMDKMEAESAKPLTNRLEAMRESVVANATGLAELHDRLALAAQQQQILAHETEVAVLASKAQAAAAQALEDLHKGNDLTILEARHKAGLVSEEQYAAQRLAIVQWYVEQKRASEERAAVRENEVLRLSIERAKAQQPGLVSAAEEAEKKKTKALEDLNSYDKAGIEKRHEETPKELKKFESGLPKEWVQWFENMGTGKTATTASEQLTRTKDLSPWEATRGFKGMFGADSIGDAYARWESLKRDTISAEKDFKDSPGVEARRKVAAEKAARGDAEANRLLEENAAHIRESTRKHDDRRDEIEAQHETNEERSGKERNANKLKGPLAPTAINDVLVAAEIAHKLGDTVAQYLREHPGTRPGDAAAAVGKEHAEPTADDRKRLTDLAKRLDNNANETLPQAIALLGQAHGNSQAATQKVVEFSTKTVQIMENLWHSLGPVVSRQDRLEAEIRAMRGNPTTRTLPGE